MSFCLNIYLYSVYYLKKKLYRHHYLGIVLISLGVILVGVACLIGHDHSEDDGKNSIADLIAGIVLLQVGIFMGAAGFIIEEKFMKDSTRLDPVLIVGCEGSSACIIWLVILCIFQFIPCYDDTFCTNNRLEDTYGAWLDYKANPILIYQSLAIVILIPFSSICGVTTTKRGSAS